jgi:redox-sensing transcriptional repressor
MKEISIQTLKRLPLYLSYLKTLPSTGAANISATAVSAALGLNEVLVRKDLAAVGQGGRPKIGYIVEELIEDLETNLGFRDCDSAVLVGAGNLGSALLNCDEFSEYHLDIVTAFDSNEKLVGTKINGKPVLSAEKLGDLCSRMKIKIGIIAVPGYAAQDVCDRLVAAGILAIWNFAPVKLTVPKDVMVLDENIGASLTVLKRHLYETVMY